MSDPEETVPEAREAAPTPSEATADASAEVFAAMDGSTLAEAEAAEGNDEAAGEGAAPAE